MKVEHRRIIIKGLLIAAALILTINFGCEMFPESSFELSSESRLPKWFELPPGIERSNVSLTMDYYSKPWGGTAGFKLGDKTNRILAKMNGSTKCNSPFHLKDAPHDSRIIYPNYEAVSINGITEIFEQRKPEPFLYVTDDPVVWKQYELSGC